MSGTRWGIWYWNCSQGRGISNLQNWTFVMVTFALTRAMGKEIKSKNHPRGRMGGFYCFTEEVSHILSAAKNIFTKCYIFWSLDYNGNIYNYICHLKAKLCRVVNLFWLIWNIIKICSTDACLCDQFPLVILFLQIPLPNLRWVGLDIESAQCYFKVSIS